MKFIQLAGSWPDGNVFLALGNEEAVLFDSGSGGRPELFSKRINGNLNGRKLVAIALTHEHKDHSGGAKELSKLLSVPTIGHDETNLCSRRISNGDVFSQDEHSWEVIFTPGHSIGSVCYYNQKTNDMVTGDTLFTFGAFGRFDLPGGDSQKLAGSIEKLLDYDVKGVYPGHDLHVINEGNRHVRASHAALRAFLGQDK